MRIDITFDEETTALIDEAVTSYNAASGETLTPEQWLARNLSAEWEAKRQAAILDSGRRLTEAALALPKAARDEVIAFIQGKLNGGGQ